MKAKGVPVAVYEPTLDAPEFFGSEVTHDPEAFKAGCDVIVANRWSDELANEQTRCTRGICLSGTSYGKKKVMLVFGTLAEAIKMCPLVNELNVRKNEYETVVTVTGQHREMLAQILRVFDIAPQPAR